MFQIYFCDLEVYSMIMIFHLKDKAHTDLNIWPLSIWYHCQADHAECSFRCEYRGSSRKVIWAVYYLLGCPDLLGNGGLTVHLFI